jgi:hypothetical protein
MKMQVLSTHKVLLYLSPFVPLSPAFGGIFNLNKERGN